MLLTTGHPAILASLPWEPSEGRSSRTSKRTALPLQ
jgi:hypothetical protein